MQSSVEKFLQGDSEMKALIRQKDWSTSRLGPMKDWPPALRTALGIALSSKFPMVLWWGKDLLMLYNDAWRPVLGATKHPQFLGEPGEHAWTEIWNVIGPMLHGVMKTGEATWVHDQLLVLNRNNYFEEAYFTYSYSPIYLENGTVGGVFSAVHETTETVISNRRIRLLRDLAASVTDVDPVDSTLAKITDALLSCPKSVPFAALYMVQAELAVLKTSTTALPLDLAPVAIPLQKFGRAGLNPLFPEKISVEQWSIDSPAWKEPVRWATWVPLASSEQSKPIGYALLGINPRRPVDESYRNFIHLLVGQIGAAINSSVNYEQEIQKAQALAELDRAKTAFFNNVSHEFRTPLTLILGPLDQAQQNKSDLSLDEVTVVARNAQRLLKLVNNLLDFSRIEAGRHTAAFAETDISKFTTDIASIFRSAIESAGLAFEVRCGTVTGPVYIDRDMWEKIVLNFLSNALKFTVSGSISVQLFEEEDKIILRVSDTGTGIAEDELAKVFERFHRAKNEAARTHEGTGIGLALVKELVKMHGGTVSAASEIGVGTTFEVTIPKGFAHLPADQLVQTPGTEVASGQARQFVEEALHWQGPDADNKAGELFFGSERRHLPCVLLADDNADMRDYLKRSLQNFWSIDIATNGKQALEKIQEKCPDLVISDVMMPEMDGFELLRCIRSDKQTQHVPVILLSARAGEEARIEGLNQGADDYLVKPFSLKELFAKASILLESRAVASQLRKLVDEKTIELQQIGSILSEFVESGDFRAASRGILQLALDSTQSEYGFIGATVPGGPQGTILRVFADLGFNWSAKTNRQLYEKVISDYDTKGHIDFPLLDNLFGWPILHGEPLIANDPQSDSRKSGRQPSGHPPMRNFLGLPIFKGDEIVGSIGIANRPGGYTDEHVKSLDYLAKTASVIYESYRRLQHENLIIQERTVAEDNLRQANQALLDIAYSVSHELQEPITGLRSNIGLLAARYRDRLGIDADEFIQNALLETGKVARMVDDLWTYARIERPHLKFEPVDLNELFDKTMIAMQQEIAAANANVTRGVLPTLNVERRELGVALRQLLSNAITFRSARPTIELTAELLVDEWLFCVTDNGIGFHQPEAHEVFKMFRKLNRDSPGTGMGLPIVKRIVEFHGGKIWAESEKGVSTRFYFTLPIVPVR